MAGYFPQLKREAGWSLHCLFTSTLWNCLCLHLEISPFTTISAVTCAPLSRIDTWLAAPVLGLCWAFAACRVPGLTLTPAELEPAFSSIPQTHWNLRSPGSSDLLFHPPQEIHRNRMSVQGYKSSEIRPVKLEMLTRISGNILYSGHCSNHSEDIQVAVHSCMHFRIDMHVAQHICRLQHYVMSSKGWTHLD